MGFFSFVGSVLSGISSAISSIGSAISSGISSVIGAITTSIHNGLSGIGHFLSGFARAILSALDVTQEPAEDFGARVLQAREHGIKLDTSEEFEAYMEKLSKFEPDPDKSKQYSSAEKIAAAMTIGTVAMEKKFDIDPEDAAKIWLLPMLGPTFFNPERVMRIASEGRLLDVLDYLEGKLTPDEGLDLVKQLLTAEQRLNPAAEIDALRRELRESKEQLHALYSDTENYFKTLDERLQSSSSIPHDGMPFKEVEKYAQTEAPKES